MDLIITNADWICLITRNESHIDHPVHVRDPGIPDHYSILVKLRLRKRSIPRKDVLYRNLKIIDYDNLYAKRLISCPGLPKL